MHWHIMRILGIYFKRFVTVSIWHDTCCTFISKNIYNISVLIIYQIIFLEHVLLCEIIQNFDCYGDTCNVSVGCFIRYIFLTKQNISKNNCEIAVPWRYATPIFNVSSTKSLPQLCSFNSFKVAVLSFELHHKQFCKPFHILPEKTKMWLNNHINFYASWDLIHSYIGTPNKYASYSSYSMPAYT